MRYPMRPFRSLVVATFLISGLAIAQPTRVSVHSAVTAALQNHASVRIADARVSAAAAQYEEAGARLLPKVQLSGRAVQLSDVEQGTITVPFLPGSPTFPLFDVIKHSYAARVQLTQPLFTGFRLAEAKEAARYGMEAAGAERSNDESDLALDVQTAYWSWVQAREARRVMDETARQMKEHEDRVMNMEKQGLTTQADVLAIRTRRSDVEVKAIEMRTKASLAMMRLNFLMGTPLETELEPIDLPESIQLDAGGTDPDAMTLQALDARPDLASARYRNQMARSAVSMANAGWYPTVSLAAAYEYSNPNQRIIPPKDQFDGSWEVGVTFQWTVWDWMTTSKQAAQAEANQRKAEAGYQLMVDGVRLEIAQLTRQLADSREKVESARLGVEAASESFRITEEQFSKGLATSVDVTDARVDALRADLAFTQAAVEAALTKARLIRATGESNRP